MPPKSHKQRVREIRAEWGSEIDPLYSTLTGYTTLGTAAFKNVGIADIDVIGGADGRLTDARTPVVHPHGTDDVTTGRFLSERLPNIMYQCLAPTEQVTIPAGYGGVVSAYYEIAPGYSLSIEVGAFFEIM